MFYCEICNKLVQGKCNLLTTKRKIIQHPSRPSSNKKRNEETGRWEYTPDNGGSGYQIAREVKTCDNCYLSPLWKSGYDENGNLQGLAEGRAILNKPVVYRR